MGGGSNWDPGKGADVKNPATKADCMSERRLSPTHVEFFLLSLLFLYRVFLENKGSLQSFECYQ